MKHTPVALSGAATEPAPRGGEEDRRALAPKSAKPDPLPNRARLTHGRPRYRVTFSAINSAVSKFCVERVFPRRPKSKVLDDIRY